MMIYILMLFSLSVEADFELQDSPIVLSQALSPDDLSSYQDPAPFTALTSIVNLSGITYNPVADEYITVHQNKYCRLDNSLNELFCGSLACGDCEDISYLGVNGEFYEYAIVEEGGSEGSVIIAQSPMATHNVRLDQISTQTLTYAATAGGDSGEGVAYDAVNNIIYVCIEDPNMLVLAFNRPADNNDATYSDGSLSVTEALTTAQLNGLLGNSSDLSSCYFNHDTGRLLIMSDIAHNISDIDLSGTLFDQITLPDRQVEGFTFNADFKQLIVTSEPRDFQIYTNSDKVFGNGFE